MADSDSKILTTLSSVLSLIFEFFILILKVNVAIYESIYKLFTTEERNVSGEIVLITGTGHGIGKEMALQYSALGATIVCWDINEHLNLDTINLIKSMGRKAHGYTVDVTNREKVLEAANKVLSDVGVVTILVNNAGIMPQHDMLKHTEKEIRMIFEINVLAHFWMFEGFLPKMIEENRGHIVALSSMAGQMGIQNLVPYCGSKYAVRGIMDSLSEELRSKSNGFSNIKFTTVCPYMIDTGLCKKIKIRFEKLMPVVRPKDAAAAIISAQRKNLEEVSIPRHLIPAMKILKLLPKSAGILVMDFFEAFVESDK